MAKCDMCSRASRGVVHKCSQCKLSICKECCETGKLEGDSRHHLDPEIRAHDPFQLATKPAQGASVPSGYAVNERVASLNYTIAREDQGTGVQFPTATSQSRQQTNTYGGNAAAATLAAINSPSPSPPPADHVQQPPSPDHEALALPLYVETLSRNLVQETYQTYHRNNPAPSLDLSLRYELCYLWRQRLIPQHGIDQGFRIALEIGYRAATQLGLDPLRNAAREWLRQTERQLYGAGN
ncbi:hypothetical protein ACO1O0_000286 [Amphichorda felina]